MSDTRFDAFISYSRRASTSLAADLQSAIERFAKPWYRLRAVRVFRDDSSMSASVALWSTIERALTESQWFILLASPQSAASEWVDKELRWWLEHKGADRILIVLDEGQLFWDAAAGDFDWSRTTAVSRALSGAFAEEPRWVELDWYEADGSLRREDPRWMERVADLAAAVRFAERDELVGENVREHRRARRLLRAGIAGLAGLLVASLIATVIAVVQGTEAQAQARVSLARQLAAQALALRATDVQLASLLAVEAYRLHDDEQTSAALFQTATSSPALERTLLADAAVSKVDGTPDGAVIVAGTVDGQVLRWDDGVRTDLGSLGVLVAGLAVDDTGDVVAAVAPGAGTAWIGGVESQVAGGDTVALAPDGTLLAIFDGLRTLVFERTGSEFAPAGEIQGGAPTMAIDESGVLSWIGRAGDWGRADLRSREVIATGELFFSINNQGVAISGDGRLVTVGAGGTTYPLFETAGDSTYDAPDAVTTSQIAGPLAMALSGDGYLFAAAVDSAMYVSRVRGVDELAETPRVLDGGGETTPGALEFLGERYLVSASGSQVLMWDLAQASRITREFEVPVPEDCRACGPPALVVSPDGTRAVAVTRSGGGPLTVYDAESEASAVARDGDSGAQTAAWLDDDRLAFFVRARGEVVVVSGDALATVDASIPVAATDAVAMVATGADSLVLLDAVGALFTIDVGTGAVVETPSALQEAMAAGPSAAMAIAPDGSTAFVGSFDASGDLVVTAVDAATGAAVFESAGAAAAYAEDSVLRFFADDWVSTLDAASGSLRDDRVPAAVEVIPPPLLSPDGRIVVNGGLDGSIEFIDLSRWGSLLGAMSVPDQENAFAFSGFSGDGTRLFTAVPAMESNGFRSTMRVTDMTIDGWIAALCATAGRDITAQEWAIYSDTSAPADLRCVRS